MLSDLLLSHVLVHRLLIHWFGVSLRLSQHRFTSIAILLVCRHTSSSLAHVCLIEVLRTLVARISLEHLLVLEVLLSWVEHTLLVLVVAAVVRSRIPAVARDSVSSFEFSA